MALIDLANGHFSVMTQCFSSIHMSRGTKSLSCVDIDRFLRTFFSDHPSCELIGTDRGIYYLDHANGKGTYTFVA
jgi:hypothetical protein